MKRLVILGSTGSIGAQTIDVALKYPDRFEIAGLAARSRIDLLEKQVSKLNPSAVAVYEAEPAAMLAEALKGTEVTLLSGMEGLLSLCRLDEADVVVNALVGSIGLQPTLETLKERKTLCLSNKESLVVGGELVTSLARNTKSPILPIDSEHSAVFQCLQSRQPSQVEKIIITGSGGPFRGRKSEDLKNVSVEEALAHPRWKMGRKITIDSATLMNKGLEVIEAHFLFDVPYDAIEVVIHPESIVHSMVQFKDGSVIAQLGPPDMRLPIQYALTYPERLPSLVRAVNLAELGELHFEPPDVETFRCLRLSYEAGRAGRTYPAVLNAANEEAVAAFLERRIGFLDIAEIVHGVLEEHQPPADFDLGSLLEAERKAREHAARLIKKAEGQQR